MEITQGFDDNRQQFKAELYQNLLQKRAEAREIRMANGGVDTQESKTLDQQADKLKKTIAKV
ncbi:hypothetical protein SB773_33110, partial [Bacillus sp. SIMBA_074]|uniref:hypothetical protein n=1 Tax=Bacillus sp. SIMBA_074 TaxID=3085812 RepID=UPI00397C1064